jgi:small-conductance mechanosensitive channel
MPQAGNAVLTAVLDSLRAQISRLESQVARLQPANTGGGPELLPGPPPGQAPQAEGLDAARRAQQTAQDVRHFTLRAIWAAILFFVAWLGIRGAAWLLNVLSERSAKRRLFFKKLIPIVRLLVWSLAVFYVISTVFEVDRAGLLAGTAALGVGIGFAAQGVLKNVFGGLIIIFDQPFQVGDKIRVAGTYGEVVSIGMRATRIVTPDDNLVSVPNAQIVEDQVANANAGNLDCQVVVDLYLPGWVDVAKAKAIAFDAAVNSQYTYLDKPVVVNVKDEFDRIFLTHLVVKAYVIDTRYEFALASDITETAKAEFLRNDMVPVMPIEADMTALPPSRHGAEPNRG